MKSKKWINILTDDKNAANRKIEPYDTPATVKRVENGTAWVHIAGGVDETPVKLTMNAKTGDTVQVRVSGGRAWLTGNATAPPTDDTRAIKADATAVSAKSVADSAMNSANIAADAAGRAISSATAAATAASAAQTSANNALTSAKNASDYASRALGNLSTVQSVAETLTYITAHGTMTLTTDVAIDPTHVYFVVDPAGDYTVNSVKYSIVTEPNVANIGTYYELSIDESLQNYVGTHLALTQEGLWLLPATNGTNKVLIATGAGSTYTTAGTYLIDSSGGTVASFRADGTTITNGSTDIAHLGYGPGNNNSGGISNAPYYTFGKRKSGEAVGNYSVAEGNETTASALGTHAEGGNVNVSGVWHYLTASGGLSHAEGGGTTASGRMAHSEGYATTASGDYSHAQNRFTIADQGSQTAIGKFNTANLSNNLFVIGNGTADDARSDAFKVDTSGNVEIAGNVNIPTGANYCINNVPISSGGGGGDVTGVKGNAESTYRTGNVNLTSANIGAIDSAGTGLTKSSTTLNHTNSVTAQTTQAVYPIKIDAQGHISAYGTAVTIPSKTSDLTNDSGYITSSSIPSYTATSPIDITNNVVSHETSGVTAGSKGDTSNQTPSWGSTFKALSGTVEAKGHLTSFAEHTVRIPNAVATTSAAGLMSSEDKSNLSSLLPLVDFFNIADVITAGQTYVDLDCSSYELSVPDDVISLVAFDANTMKSVIVDWEVRSSNSTIRASIASAVSFDIIVRASLLPTA